MQPETVEGLSGKMASGRMLHRRFLPREHSFSYRLSWCWLDLDTTAELDRLLTLHKLYFFQERHPI